MRSILSSLGSLCLTLCCVFGQAPEVHALAMHEPSTTPDSAYIEFAEMFPSVGWMFTFNGTDVASFSSGVLVDEKWVLTSAHGVLDDDNDPGSTYDQFQFGLGSNVATDPGEFAFSSEVFVNPGYNGPESGPDLALLYFEDGFDSVDPADFYTGDVLDLDGTDASLAGFGVTGTPSTSYNDDLGQKRAGTNAVTAVGSPSSEFIESLFLNPNFTDGRSLGALASPGDSGGGWFLQDGDDFYLTAITSFADLNLRYGSRSFATLLQPELGWINDTIDSRAVPEPATILLLAAGVPWLRRIRNRQARMDPWSLSW